MFNKLVEKLNNSIYESQKRVQSFLTLVKFLASLAGLVILIYSFGFKESIQDALLLFRSLDIIFGIFVGVFVVRLFYSFKRWQFILRNKFETFLIALILLNLLTNYYYDSFFARQFFDLLGFDDFTGFYIFLETIYLLVIVGYELVVASLSLPSLNMKPPVLFVLSFIILILGGAGVLMLPAMTNLPGSMPFTDALFTSCSAACVTGLIVVDTATYFTLRGPLVILMLIQFGGLGIIAFALFFARFIRKNISLKEQVLMQDYFSSDSLYSAKQLLRQVVLITFAIEAITAYLIYHTWGSQVQFVSMGQKLYYSVFHAVSAFCNAGFSLFSNNLFENVVRQSYVMHLVIAFAVIMGGIGFTVIEDLFSPAKLRERMAKPWVDWRLSTKVALYVSAVLIVLGTIVIYTLEYGNTLQHMNQGERLVTSFFQSVITRTAGFNTIDTSMLKNGTVIFMIFLMFVGASSGSVGGGIKTSTFFLIMLSAWSNLRGKSRIELSGYELPKELLFKALSIFFFAASIIVFSIFLLSVFEPHIPVHKIAFEEVSAFATVGLSMGITESLSIPSKWIIIFSMFLGRVGILTFALSLSSSKYKKNYKYPSATMMVG